MNNNSEYDKFLKYGPHYKGDKQTSLWSKKEDGAYDFLEKYSKVFNHYTASTIQPNPFSNKVMFIIDMLNKAGVKYSIDIFEYNGSPIYGSESYAKEHKLVNIIAEPNPGVSGPATLFVAHHDIANPRSENCQDNGASVCHLLTLANLIGKSKEESKRTILLFTDCEEVGTRGAKRFANDSKVDRDTKVVTHDKYGEISRVVNLELTGVGKVIWSDCESKKADCELHSELEEIFGGEIVKLRTPSSDVIAFRGCNYPAVCIGTLKEDDLKDKNTWRLCHSMDDTLDKCSREDMEDFTKFLLDITKVKKAEPKEGESVTSPS
ncbi:MAG TPA: M28 family peptidase [Candidatus Glassbacteria bacterium]|nr:M28 family peptidase [Candidatus Glassbacteria bacterium]